MVCTFQNRGRALVLNFLVYRISLIISILEASLISIKEGAKLVLITFSCLFHQMIKRRKINSLSKRLSVTGKKQEIPLRLTPQKIPMILSEVTLLSCVDVKWNTKKRRIELLSL